MDNNLLKRISGKMPGFSKGQKRIANYIIKHFDKAAFMTAARLGETVGVSESTVVRFACEIGFDGYPDMQKALQTHIRNRLTAVQRMDVTVDQLDGSDVLSRVLTKDIEKIKRTIEESDDAQFRGAVDAICRAENIYIIGVRSASALAQFMAYYFHHIFANVRLINTTSRSEMFEQIMRIGANDVFIGLSFPRYSKRTAQAAQFARANDAKVVAVTDSNKSPLAVKADYVLLARSDMVSFVDSLVAPLSLINALIVAIGIKKRNELARTYERLERIWDEYEVYEKHGDDLSER